MIEVPEELWNQIAKHLQREPGVQITLAMQQVIRDKVAKAKAPTKKAKK